MAATWIVEAFDEIEDGKTGFTRILEPMFDEQLALEDGVDAAFDNISRSIVSCFTCLDKDEGLPSAFRHSMPRARK